MAGSILAFFDGLDLTEPGLVPAASWRATPTADLLWATRGFLAAVATKP